MSIRRTIRKALQTGTTMYAKVEETNLGLATVLLGGTGARMTNLSTVGGPVVIGDTVIVDWSAGINPIVRPLFIEEDPEELPPGVSAPENVLEEEDISTFQDSLAGGWFNPPYWSLTVGVPYIWFGGRYDWWDSQFYQEYFDSANICKNVAIFEDGVMTIPRDGKYLVGMACNEVTIHNNQDADGSIDPVEQQCHYRIRIIKNNSTPIAVGTGQWSVDWYGAPGINLTAFEPLLAGDRLTFEIYFTSTTVVSMPLWLYGFFEGESRSRWLIYLPGT
jgi:hypothetical protein